MPKTIKVYTDADAKPALVKDRPVAVIGYGSQGRAHAMNLKESGCEVIVGLRDGSPTAAKARADGLTVMPVAEAAKAASLVALLTPDMSHEAIYASEIAPNLEQGDALLVAHGFTVLYERIQPADGIDVILVAPKGPGDLVRREYERGAGVPCLFAVRQDATGEARERALAYASLIGGTTAARKPRPICSASRPCCAAVRPNWSLPGSRRWWMRATSPKSPITSACTN